MTANTWEFGDYIEYVFDDWLADPTGRFLLAEEKESGRIAAIDKLSMLSPTEAWFEGLRVHPDFRGQGLAGRLQKYMIGEAARLGADTIRLITLANNTPIHLACYRDGFVLKCLVRFWKWEDSASQSPPEAGTPGYALRYATAHEAPILYDWWHRSSAFRTAGLAHYSWSYARSSPEEWVTAANEHRLLVKDDAPIDPNRMPPPTALVRNDTNHTGAPIWVLSALTALSEEWTRLLLGLITAARAAGIIEINGLQPDTHEINNGLQSAGFTGDADEDRLCLFELSLSSSSA
jgi:GNAT superfamily N-acetyltransferase